VYILVYADVNHGAFIRGEMKKNSFSFLYLKNMAYFEVFYQAKQTSIISEGLAFF